MGSTFFKCAEKDGKKDSRKKEQHLRRRHIEEQPYFLKKQKCHKQNSQNTLTRRNSSSYIEPKW